MKIGKEGKVWRLTKETWETLAPYDSDPNIAIAKILTTAKAPSLITRDIQPAATAIEHPCRFDEQRLLISFKRIVKESMVEALEPFSGE